MSTTTSTRACCASPPAAAWTTARSTLIGRLLYETNCIFEDQFAAVARTSREARRRPRGSGAAAGRPGRRARAGHHHRRGLPLLHHRQAQVHHRRHAGPRAVHAEHGHRRLDQRAGHHPDRRPARRADPAQATRLPDLAAADPSSRGGGQQDGPGGLRRGRLRRHRAGVLASSRRSWTFTTSRSFPSAPWTGTTSPPAATRCPGTTATRCCTSWRTCTWPRTRTSWTSVSRCST